MSRKHRHESEESTEGTPEVASMMNELERLASADVERDEQAGRTESEHQESREERTEQANLAVEADARERGIDVPAPPSPDKTTPENNPNNPELHLAEVRDFNQTHRTTCPVCGTITAETICPTDGTWLHPVENQQPQPRA